MCVRVCVCVYGSLLSFDVLEYAFPKEEINVDHAANLSKKAEFR